MTRAEIFVTCMVDLFRPRAAIAAVHVLERRGVDLEVPDQQSCCGQFAYNAGHHREAAAMGRQLVRAFEGKHDGGVGTSRPPVIALSGSCAAMVTHELPSLLEHDALQRRGDRTEGDPGTAKSGEGTPHAGRPQKRRSEGAAWWV